MLSLGGFILGFMIGYIIVNTKNNWARDNEIERLQARVSSLEVRKLKETHIEL